ncbi:hypothetical protein A0256_13760 [Mucilaginibacter sp. PAMC 26640]|nr:hypothetical protein A0256_13760 [Mucilaginibacter sp. PAMC 26640]
MIALGLSKDILKPYSDPHRFYHTLEHLDDVWDQLAKKGFDNNDALLLAAMFQLKSTPKHHKQPLHILKHNCIFAPQLIELFTL